MDDINIPTCLLAVLALASDRHHDDFIDALDDAGNEEWGPGRWPKGFRLNRAAHSAD